MYKDARGRHTRGGRGARTLGRPAPDKQGGVANLRIGREPAAQCVGLGANSFAIAIRSQSLNSKRSPAPRPSPSAQKRLRSPGEDSHAPNKRAWGSELQKLMDGGSIIAEMAVPEED